MKKTTCLLLILLLGNLIYSQRVRKATIKAPALQAYINNTTALGNLSFTYYPYSPLELHPDTVLFKLKYGQPYGDIYTITYSDQRYLFEKQFGIFPDDVFQKTMDSVKKKYNPCEYYWFTGKISKDQVTIEIHEACPEKGDDAIFMRVKNTVDFKGGPSALEQYISQSIPADTDQRKNKDRDSILYYRLIIKRDSLAHEVTQLDGSGSPVENSIKTALANSRPWTPFYHGGIILNAYIYVYVILHKDGTITVGYSRP